MELLSIFRIKRVRIVLYSFIGFCLLLGFSVYKSTQNPYGSQLEIANLNKYTSGRPIDQNTLNYIKHNLYKTVNLNNSPSVKNNSIKDILIRNESFSQTYNTSTHVYTVHFIVDIKSLKQSYRVEYQWVTNSEYGPNKAEYGTQVSCLPLNELIYGNFHCKDQNTISLGSENYDPVAPLLPYYVAGRYRINSYNKSENYTVLHVDAFAPATDTTVSQSTLDSYTNDINSWLQSNKLDPNKYMIDYNY